MNMKERYGYISVLFCVFLLIFFLSSCVPKAKVKVFQRSLEEQASLAWKDQNWILAKNLYLKLFAEEKKKKRDVIEKIIICCVKDKDFEMAKEYLDKWRQIFPEDGSKWIWYKTYAFYLKATEGVDKYRSYLLHFILEDFSEDIKVSAIKELNKDLIKEKEFDDFFNFYEAMFKKLENSDKRVRMVEAFWEGIRGISYAKIGDMVLAISPDKNIFEFPYVLIKWHKLALDLEKKAITWSYAWGKFVELIKGSQVEVRKVLIDRFKELVKIYKPLKIKVGLLLPLDGINISWKILEGAELAQVDLMAEGLDVEVQVINTLDKQWDKRLIESSCNIWGGVLKKNVWERISKERLFNKKFFFVFRSVEQGGDLADKKNIFSFFLSYQDQIVPIVKLLSEKFDITKFAVFAPRSEYGEKMANIFEKLVKKMGFEFIKKGFYTLKRHSLWKYEVADFLGIPEEFFKDENFDKESFKLQVDFQAVFLPDSFEEAKILIPEFFFFDVNNIFFIGPILWSFENTKISRIDSLFYKLTIFPSPWNFYDKSLGDKVKDYYFNLSADFWVGLGYDFVRFVANMINSLLTMNTKEIKEFLHYEKLFNWTIAPITWDEKGTPSQTLYLFQPSIRGPVKFNFERVKKVYDMRIEEKKERETEEEKQQMQKEQGDEDNKE